jgi:hypothetical protein
MCTPKWDSIVWTIRSGPPWTSALLILFVPCPGMSTHESRGMPTIAIACWSGFRKIRWRESESEWLTSSPGRAPLPTARITIGFEPVSVGA